VSRYGKLSNCLRGTQIDGGLQVDGTGNLIISGEIKSLFEYFLSAMHEEGQDTSIARIKEYIELTLPNPAREEALKILDDYLNYRNNLKRFNPGNLSEKSKAEALMDLKAAIYERELQRREFLSPEVVDAFFAEEEAFDHYNLSRMEIEYDESLNDDQKLQMLSELNRRLPDGIRESRTYRTQEAVLKKKVEELKVQGGKEDEIYELRKNFYGETAADRLAELDRERRAWQNRFDDYYISKQIILTASDLSDNEKELQINRLKMETFSESELYKVDIFEEIRDEQQKN
jgi:lipase chaperone LimK